MSVWPDPFEPKELTEVEKLIGALESEDKEVSKAAYKALVELGEPAVLPLVSALKKEKTRYEATCILGEIGDVRAVEPLIKLCADQFFEGSDQPHKAISQIGEGAVLPLIAALTDECVGLRCDAINLLGRIRDPRALDPIIQALEDEDEIIRNEAALAVGGFKDNRAIPALSKALKVESLLVWDSAAFALGEIGSKEAARVLREALEDRDARVRKSARQALARIQRGSWV